MKSLWNKPAVISKRTEELRLSGSALLELMRAVLARGAPLRFRARGRSMSPFIRDGDEITISPFVSEKLSLGQVVAFIQPENGKLVVHRVIGRQGEAYLIQGDNAIGSSDGWISMENILGQVTRVERNGKKVYLGLGLDKTIIAALSRNGLLKPLLARLRLIFKAILPK